MHCQPHTLTHVEMERDLGMFDSIPEDAKDFSAREFKSGENWQLAIFPIAVCVCDYVCV